MSKWDDIGTCTECHSDQPDDYTDRQLAKGWDRFPCKWCGGVAMMVAKENRNNALKQSDRRRGI